MTKDTVIEAFDVVVLEEGEYVDALRIPVTGTYAFNWDRKKIENHMENGAPEETGCVDTFTAPVAGTYAFNNWDGFYLTAVKGLVQHLNRAKEKQELEEHGFEPVSKEDKDDRLNDAMLLG